MVDLSVVYFLDLFSPEQVNIFGNRSGHELIDSMLIFNPNNKTTRFATETGLSAIGNVLTFPGSNLNAPPLLPASVLLLGGVLGAFGIARRRNRKTK